MTKPMTDNLSIWQSELGYVPQSAFIADGTITKNIAFGVPGSKVDFASVKKSAQTAQISEFIETELPQQYENLVGEHGVQLSGGQRQRLAIARTILKNAPVLILDEATSALDSESEKHVQAALESLMKGRTTVVIAHRLSTIENADRIVVLDKGGIAEFGTHAELLLHGGIYARLYNIQFASGGGTASSV